MSRNHKVNILFHQYPVLYVDAEDMVGKDDVHGEFCAEDQTIKVNRYLPKTLEQEVTFHEVMEALNFHYELGLEHHDLSLIGNAILSFLLSNKRFVKEYLLN